MKKILLSIAATICLAATLTAQNVKPTTMQIGSDKIDAYSTTVTHSQATTEEIVANTLKNLGLTVTNIDNCYAAIGQEVIGVANDKIDLYLRVETPENQPTTVTLGAVPSEGSQADEQQIKKGLQTLLSNLSEQIYDNNAHHQDAEMKEGKIRGERITDPGEHPNTRIGMMRGGKHGKLKSGQKIDRDGGKKMEVRQDKAEEMKPLEMLK